MESKLPEKGGVPNTVVCNPEVLTIDYSDDIDLCVLGCDGIFDVLSNEEVADTITETFEEFEHDTMKKKRFEIAINRIIVKAMERGSEDNLTVIIVAFA